MITEQHSQAFDIRDSVFNVLTADPYFASYTKKKNKMLPVQPGYLPFLGVYLVDEVMAPDGDANAGCIRFSHTVRIGLSIINANNDQDAAEQASDSGFWKAMQLLWTDKNLMNVFQTTNAEGVLVESVTRGLRRHVYGSTGSNNETPFVECQYELNCYYRTEWYPDITDTLGEIDVTVVPNNDPNANPFNIIYDFVASKQKGNGHG